MFTWLGERIYYAYTWFWRDLLCRTEPFTYQFRRFCQSHPLGLLVTICLVQNMSTWLLFHLAGWI